MEEGDVVLGLLERTVDMGAPVRRSFTNVHGIRVHCAEMGDPHAPPVVLLHGWSDCHLTWHRIAPELARTRRVLMPDLPGHGLTDRPDASYRLDWHAELLARFLHRFGVPRADFVGHSFGGGVAQMMLLRHRARIGRLALVASGGLGREVFLGLRLASIPRLVERIGQRFMASVTRLTLEPVRHLLHRDHVDVMSAINAQAGSARALARTLQDVVNLRGQRRTFYERAREVRDLPPIAVFWGENDAIIPAMHARTFADSVEGVQLRIFRGRGHSVHHEEPELPRALHAFLDAPSLANARLREAA